MELELDEEGWGELNDSEGNGKNPKGNERVGLVVGMRKFIENPKEVDGVVAGITGWVVGSVLGGCGHNRNR